MNPGVITFIVGWVLLVLLLVGAILFAQRYKRSYVFSVHSHDVRLTVRSGGIFLYVDGRLEEQVSGQNMRFATLHATVDGQEFKVHVSARGIRTQVQAVYDGREIALMGVER